MIVPVRRAGPRRPRRIAILGNAAGTTARAYGHFFPQTAIDGVEIDGELTDIGRRYFDMRGAAAAHVHRRRAAVPAPHEAALRRDLRRCLPPAVHPVLPRDAGVLRARPRPPAPGRRRRRQRRPSGGLDEAREVLGATMARRLPDRRCAIPPRTSNTLLLGTTGSASARACCAQRARRCRPTCARSRSRPRRGRAAPARAAASTPTTAPCRAQPCRRAAVTAICAPSESSSSVRSRWAPSRRPPWRPVAQLLDLQRQGARRRRHGHALRPPDDSSSCPTPSRSASARRG